ncbi:MAG TPA: hypothetical protein VJ521_07335, partial [Acidobacteriota bacterium]|nr:hypothetical protein [Acidobacteriota bacterium]
MMRLQLRTPCNITLDVLVSELSLRILESVKRELDSMEVPFQSYRNLESSVVDALSPFLSVSTLCGTHLVCTDGIGAEP